MILTSLPYLQIEETASVVDRRCRCNCSWWCRLVSDLPNLCWSHCGAFNIYIVAVFFGVLTNDQQKGALAVAGGIAVKIKENLSERKGTTNGGQ